MMKTSKIIKLKVIIIAAFIVSWSNAMAGQMESTMSLEPTKEHPGATGLVAINGDQLKIDVKGLRPDSVYTAWFVNTKPKKNETGAGQPPYMFKTDAAGNGKYTSTLDESPYGNWQMIMIVLHPDGDPKNMKNMVGALKADLT
jgi:hypothetical protein